MKTSTHVRTGILIAMAIALTSALSVTSAAEALKEPGVTSASSVSVLGAGNCPLERVGTEYVRCDNLTGAGVPAPAWVPELTSHTAQQPASIHGTTP